MRAVLALATLLGLCFLTPEIAAAQTPDSTSVPPASADLGAVDSTAVDSTAAKTSASSRSRSVAGRAKHMVKSFASDVGYVVVSPTRLRGRGIVYTAAAVGATVALYGYDNEIRRGFFRSRGNALYDDAITVGDKLEKVGFMGKTWPYWVGGALVGTAFKIHPLQGLCLDVIESHLISGGVRNIAKLAIGREHPFEAERASFFKHGTSAPSGHTSVVYEIATVATRHTHGMPTPVRIGVGVTTYGIATCIAMQRVDSNSHWPSDVFLGGVSGAVIANTVVNRNNERREKDGLTAGGPRLTPWIDATGTPGVALAWSF